MNAKSDSSAQIDQGAPMPPAARDRSFEPDETSNAPTPAAMTARPTADQFTSCRTIATADQAQ